MADTSVFQKTRSFGDYERLQQEFDMQKLAAAQNQQLVQAQIKKAGEIDADKLGEQAFLKAAQGIPLTPQEAAAAKFLDAKSGGVSFNPVTGEMIQKPRISDKIGIDNVSISQEDLAPIGQQDIEALVIDESGAYSPNTPAFNMGDPVAANRAAADMQAKSLGVKPQEEGNQFDLMYEDALRNAAGNPKLQQTIKADYLKNKTSFTEGQANAGLYADRMRAAEQILQNPDIAAAGMDVGQVGKRSIPLLGNFLVTDEFQQSEQAKRDFVNATLRRESGAVISPAEFANAERQYFPQPGDSEAVLQQKATNRANAISGITRAAGPAYTPAQIVDPYAGEKKKEAPKDIQTLLDKYK